MLRDTIRLAKTHGVAVGAHPGFPDLVGFGRRELNVTPKEAEDMVLYQVAAVAGVAAAEGVTLQHVKPHGALFNMAVRNARAVRRDRARRRGVRQVADPVRPARLGDPERRPRRRAARRGGSVRRPRLRARRLAGVAPQARRRSSTIPAAVVARAVRMVKERNVVAIDGSVVPLEADTICVHGDTPGSDDLAAKIRAGLEAAGVTVKADWPTVIAQPQPVALSP